MHPIPLRTLCLACALGATLTTSAACAQAAPASTGSTLLRGTVKAVDSSTLTLTADTGQVFTVTLAPAVRIQQLSPGSTDLKSAQPAAAADITVGDRVLVSARPGEGTMPLAARVILMKSSDINQRNEAAQADWRRRGTGGIVTAVDPAAGTVSISSGSRKETLTASGTTVVRRYTAGSVRYEDSKPSTLADLHTGDQLRVRGDRSADGAQIRADEIVFGAFRTLTGTVASIDAAAGTITLKDTAGKQNIAVTVTPASDLRDLPPGIAATLLPRTHTGTAGHGTDIPASKPSATSASEATGATSGSSGETSPQPRPRSNDLSELIGTLPKSSLAALKPGAALMIVASGATDAPSSPLTAITVLSGVEPLLSAAAQGGRAPTLSPWNLGSGDAGPATP